MPTRLRKPCLALVLVLTLAGRAGRADGAEAPAADDAPTGKNCLGEGRTRLLVAEGIYAQSNPLGAENQLQLGLCTPLVREPGVLFDYTNAQFGAVLNVAPVYAMPGAFVSVAPLSILELRAEAEAVRNWTIGMDNAGYFPRTSANEQFRDLPAALARPASGYTAAFTATLQAEIELAPRSTLVAVDSGTYAYWHLGDAEYYYHPRYDLVMRRDDWLGRNTAVLLVGRELSKGLVVRAGLTDELTWVASSGYRQNILAGILMAVISRWPGEASETQPFIRIGGYTEHAFRSGVQVLGGIATTFDAMPARTPVAH
jgi:hypothetical protein